MTLKAHCGLEPSNVRVEYGESFTRPEIGTQANVALPHGV